MNLARRLATEKNTWALSEYSARPGLARAKISYLLRVPVPPWPDREQAADWCPADDKNGRMWSLDTRWFDVAVVMSIFAIGNVLFGHFEQHKPRARRVLKVAIVLGVTLLVAETLGRAAAYGLLAIPLVGAAYVHLVWLPKHGINGWTGEPRDKYLALVTKKT